VNCWPSTYFHIRTTIRTIRNLSKIYSDV